MITGNAEVRWELRTEKGSQNTRVVEEQEFTDEAEAREAFDDACRHPRVARAKLAMVVAVEAASHSKTVRP